MKIKTLLISIFLIFSASTTYTQVLEQDSLALVAFYNSTGGPNWNNNSGWLTSPVSTWYGVTVEGDRVKKIILNSNNLSGTLPSTLGQLTALVTLACSNDIGLTGELPPELFQIDSLKQIGIGNCSCLVELNFPQNNLTGLIPPEIGNLDSLKFLDLHDNQLTGSIPPELGNCTNLKELQLNNNNLTGGLPAELASINDLNGLTVSYNNLSGPVPDEFSYQISYWAFHINNNHFDYLPPFNNWYLLSGLMVENNKLTFEHLESHAQSGYMWFYYSPQDSMGVKIDTALIPESSFSIYSGTGGEFTEYFWYRNGELILQSMEADILFIENITYADTGIYQCWAENSLATELTLVRRPARITIDTGANIVDNRHLLKNFTIYPNPASEEITILLPFKSEFVNLTIYDLGGKYVFKKEHVPVSNSKIKVGIEGLKSGIYLLQVQANNKSHSTKLIISKQGTNR